MVYIVDTHDQIGPGTNSSPRGRPMSGEPVWDLGFTVQLKKRDGRVAGERPSTRGEVSAGGDRPPLYRALLQIICGKVIERFRFASATQQMRKSLLLSRVVAKRYPSE
eukprot:5300903-Pyramimonas_sp.AAC.1